MIETRTPSIQEKETCKWLVMTSDSPWDPNSDLFRENEQAAIIAEEFTMDRDRALYSCVRSPQKTYQQNITLMLLKGASRPYERCITKQGRWLKSLLRNGPLGN